MDFFQIINLRNNLEKQNDSIPDATLINRNPLLSDNLPIDYL
jgi:hypothetical protein